MSKNEDKALLLEQLREYLRRKNYTACIISQSDPHLSEYVADYYKTREFFSGFDGSAGVLLVCLDSAILWTDGRYFIQAENQLAGTGIELYKQGVEGVPTIVEYLSENMGPNDVVITNSRCMSASKWEEMQEKFNLLHDEGWEKIWQERPILKKSKIRMLEWAEIEVSSVKKIKKVREKMQEKDVQWFLVSALDEFSWLFNLRADDIDYTPVVRGYALVGMDSACVFLDYEGICPEMNAVVYEYSQLEEVLSSLSGKIWLDKNKVNAHIYNICSKKLEIFSDESPITLLKAIKTNTEISGFKRAAINDGVVWVKLMIYIQECLNKGVKITELSINEKIIKLKSEQVGFVSESFESIVAYASNAAIVHYSATEDTDREILAEGFLLIDSGTHYEFGTTDITRTLVCGKLSEEQKKRFTQVLKGMIAVAMAEFTEGETGAQLDGLARQFLKEDGVDYLHGTGHGIGSVMCVHEDGVGISPRFIKPIMSGMVCSDEPGYYEAGDYGIRIENMLHCREIVDNQLGFETLTLVPIDLDAVDVELLTENEKIWINNYHKNIKVTLREYLTDDENLWLENKCYEI